MSATDFRLRWLVALAATVAFAAPAWAQQQGRSVRVAEAAGGPTLLGTYGSWGAYQGMAGGRKVCFAAARPTSSQTVPPNRPRDPAYVFIASRPAENVTNEISIIIGYPFKPNSTASAAIGSSTFEMYTQNDGAWIMNAAQEASMVESMRKGSDLVIKGTSGRGTQSTDTFSLKGLAQAIDRANQSCQQ
jgi:Invasion associated locus B (IalB) protein